MRVNDTRFKKKKIVLQDYGLLNKWKEIDRLNCNDCKFMIKIAQKKNY